MRFFEVMSEWMEGLRNQKERREELFWSENSKKDFWIGRISKETSGMGQPERRAFFSEKIPKRNFLNNFFF